MSRNGNRVFFLRGEIGGVWNSYHKVVDFLHDFRRKSLEHCSNADFQNKAWVEKDLSQQRRLGLALLAVIDGEVRRQHRVADAKAGRGKLVTNCSVDFRLVSASRQEMRWECIRLVHHSFICSLVYYPVYGSSAPSPIRVGSHSLYVMVCISAPTIFRAD